MGPVTTEWSCVRWDEGGRCGLCEMCYQLCAVQGRSSLGLVVLWCDSCEHFVPPGAVLSATTCTVRAAVCGRVWPVGT